MLFDVLGCDGTYPGPGSATAGFLIRSGDTAVWMDAGVGTFAQLTRRIDLAELSAVAISHSHVDHCSDLAIYHHAAAYGPARLEPLALYAPEGVVERLLACNPSALDSFDHHLVEMGTRVDLDGLRLQFGPAIHSAPAVSMRISNEAGSLLYTGDTGWDERLVDFASNTDVLVAEATIVGSRQGENGHQSAAEAGRLAQRAAAGRLVLVHVPPHLDRGQAVAEAEAEFDGVVTAAREGLTIEVGLR